jgi:hypothetical protein
MTTTVFVMFLFAVGNILAMVYYALYLCNILRIWNKARGGSPDFTSTEKLHYEVIRRNYCGGFWVYIKTVFTNKFCAVFIMGGISLLYLFTCFFILEIGRWPVLYGFFKAGLKTWKFWAFIWRTPMSSVLEWNRGFF